MVLATSIWAAIACGIGRFSSIISTMTWAAVRQRGQPDVDADRRGVFQFDRQHVGGTRALLERADRRLPCPPGETAAPARRRFAVSGPSVRRRAPV
jgi:hypothetical protein